MSGAGFLSLYGLKLISPLPSSVKKNMASVPLWGHNHFIPHNLIDLGLEVSEPKLRSKDS